MPEGSIMEGHQKLTQDNKTLDLVRNADPESISQEAPHIMWVKLLHL
jgi:hypothetical protein